MKRIKTGGRVKGSKNVVSEKLREQITDILNGYFDNLDFNKLDSQNQINLIGKILPYVLPRLANIEVKNEENKQPFNVIYLGEGINPEKHENDKN